MKKIITVIVFFLFVGRAYASSMIAYDMDTNQILESDNIHEKRPVASISKIMTAILACESGKLDDMVIIGAEINKSYGSGIYISEGENISLRDLVYGLMLRSGNDAAFAIAKYLGGTVEDFVDMMNKKAKELGMNNSIYNNPNGLDDNGGNISTAYDMALLTSYAMKNMDYRIITSTKTHVVKTNKNSYKWKNKNKLLYSYKKITGGKTGYTKLSKRTLVTTASSNGMNLVIVTLNDSDDYKRHKLTYEKLFNKYTSYTILKPGDISIINLTNKKSYYVLDSFKYDLDIKNKDNIIIEYKPSYIDNKVGKIYVYLNDKKLFETDAYENTDKKVTFWQKLKLKLSKFKYRVYD